jgi:hypothetical protein
MKEGSGLQMSLVVTIGIRWSDLPEETRQRAREQMARLLRAAALRGLLHERLADKDLAGGSNDE